MTNDKLKMTNEGINYLYNIAKRYHHLTFAIGHLTLIMALAFSMVSCAAEKEKPLETVRVERGNILAQIPSTGIVMPRNRLEIKPPLAGRVIVSWSKRDKVLEKVKSWPG